MEDDKLPDLIPHDSDYWMWKVPGFVVATSLLIGCLVALGYAVWGMP